MDYIQFNLIEGIFWIVLGLVLVVLGKTVFKQYASLALFSACVLVLFGISDFAEVTFGSFFEPGMTWLFAWKILCVVGMVIAIVWYLWIRVYKATSKK